ncbi:MAG: hypothetical protein RLZZ520_1203 [Bacteroidota bacterium]|jgi:hypothetical protein
MKFILIYVFLGLSTLGFANSRQNDTIIEIKRSNYLENLINKEGNILYIIGYRSKLVNLVDRFHLEKPQLFIKSGKNLYLSFSGSGRLYGLTKTTDSLYYFSRLDSTENINYNLGANYFLYKGQILSFGGYGFWQNFGSLKFFNFKDRQWDIIPLSEEVIPQVHPIESSWFDQKSGKLFVPFQSIVNAGIVGTENLRGKIIPFSYYLDLATKKWTKLGKPNQQLVEIITNGQFSFRMQRGMIILYYDKVYLVDFNENKLYSSDNANFNQSIGRKTYSDFTYDYKGYLYNMKNISGEVDSLKIDYTYFKDTGIPLWEPVYDYTQPLAISVFVFSLGTILFYFRKKKKLVVENTTVENKFRIQFSDTEISLLKLLIEKEKKNQRADINEVNYVLGLKHKNTGLQKKVRSDTFSSINEKYRYISKTEDILIQSIRSEIDKRYFEYYIDKRNIELIQSHV